MLPMLLLFLVLQRSIISGLTAGGEGLSWVPTGITKRPERDEPMNLTNHLVVAAAVLIATFAAAGGPPPAPGRATAGRSCGVTSSTATRSTPANWTFDLGAGGWGNGERSTTPIARECRVETACW